MTPLEAETAQKRADLLDADLVGHRWNNIPLHPWNHNREALCLALIVADAPAPDLSQIDQLEQLLEMRRTELLASEQLLPEERARMQSLTLADMVVEAGFSWQPYFPAASKTLWLAAHQPADWQHLRGEDLSAWLTEIDVWSGEHIGPQDLEAAVRLAHKIRTAHKALITIPRPSGGPHKPGN